MQDLRTIDKKPQLSPGPLISSQPEMLSEQHHFLCVGEVWRLQLVDVHTRCDGHSGGVLAVPEKAIGAGRSHVIHERRNFLAEDIKHLQFRVDCFGKIETDLRRRIERIRVVLVQCIGRRYGRISDLLTKCWIVESFRQLQRAPNKVVRIRNRNLVVLNLKITRTMVVAVNLHC